jgi:hypothetical protein
MRNATFATMLAASAVAVLVGGCGGTAPTLTVTDAFVVERAASGGQAVVHVRVKADNPTTEPLAMWAIVYNGGGGSNAPSAVERWTQATAPAGGSVAFELPLVTGAPESGSSALNISGRVAYVPGGRFRELLGELNVPLPSTTFSGTVNVDWAAAPVAPPAHRAGEVRTAAVLDAGPMKAVDTLPPLKK